jgi:integrase/recombinase XerD
MCHKWILHRFRKAFATMHHENGVSARTIQKWIRHSDHQTTLKYLAGADDNTELMKVKVNSTFAALCCLSNMMNNFTGTPVARRI